MKSILLKMNKEIIGFIKEMDPDPVRVRPVTFWFCSKHEENIYRLATRLQENGYIISCCEYSKAYGNYLCIAEKLLSPESGLLTKLCVDMQLVAERFGVEFDGWETVIDTERDLGSE